MPDALFNIAGVFYDGHTSAARECELAIADDGSATLRGSDAELGLAGSAAHAYDSLRISSRLGNTPRYIYFPGGAKFETQDNCAVDRWQSQFDKSRWVGLVHYLESHKRFVLIGVIVVLVSIWLSFKYLIPAVSAIIADQLPLSVTEQLGDSSLEMLDGYVFEESTLEESRQQHLQSLFARYFSEQIDTLKLSLYFRASETVGANAFALPSGDLVFTDDLVRLAGDDKEILAVMAHEVGHVSHRHVLRRLIQDSFLVFVLTMVTGDVSSASSVVVAAPVFFMEMAYSRRFESEADQYALDFMRANAIEPVHFSNIMRRMQWADQRMGEQVMNESSVGTVTTEDGAADSPGALEQNITAVMRGLQHYLSSHPDWEQRIMAFGEPTITVTADADEPTSD